MRNTSMNVNTRVLWSLIQDYAYTSAELEVRKLRGDPDQKKQQAEFDKARTEIRQYLGLE